MIGVATIGQLAVRCWTDGLFTQTLSCYMINKTSHTAATNYSQYNTLHTDQTGQLNTHQYNLSSYHTSVQLNTHQYNLSYISTTHQYNLEVCMGVENPMGMGIAILLTMGKGIAYFNV